MWIVMPIETQSSWANSLIILDHLDLTRFFTNESNPAEFHRGGAPARATKQVRVSNAKIDKASSPKGQRTASLETGAAVPGQGLSPWSGRTISSSRIKTRVAATQIATPRMQG
jgi:hypothetical protein